MKTASFKKQDLLFNSDLKIQNKEHGEQDKDKDYL